MIFVSFLNRFDLRTGCLSISMLHMGFIITSLHIPLHTEVKTFVEITMIWEKFLEMFTTIAELYAVFNRNRRILLMWQLTIPFMYLFNFSYFIYQSFLLTNMWMLVLWVICMYLVTYSLMLVNSYYDELGYSDSYQNRFQQDNDQGELRLGGNRSLSTVN